MRAAETTDDLIITDTSPLIALALADQLHALVEPGLRVVVPDAVWVEATRIEGAPGASELIDWIARNDDTVRRPSARSRSGAGACRRSSTRRRFEA